MQFHEFWNVCSHVTNTIINIGNISITPKSSLFRLEVKPLHLPLALGNHWSGFHPYSVALSRISCNGIIQCRAFWIWRPHLAERFWNASMLLHLSAASSFLGLSNIPPHGLIHLSVYPFTSWRTFGLCRGLQIHLHPLLQNLWKWPHPAKDVIEIRRERKTLSRVIWVDPLSPLVCPQEREAEGV